jgi:hypothetical protein
LQIERLVKVVDPASKGIFEGVVPRETEALYPCFA